ncbi:hypothetical protein, partial [Bacteroides pyogenes]|uniref:hypothetical protein n=1 Tax=Bacteroides pyogenes TaxID=310300 RepID=UPI002FDA6883
YAKAVPESAMKVYFRMAERSLTYAKIVQKNQYCFGSSYLLHSNRYTHPLDALTIHLINPLPYSSSCLISTLQLAHDAPAKAALL